MIDRVMELVGRLLVWLVFPAADEASVQAAAIYYYGEDR